MSKITWDGQGERLFEVGVDHGVLYTADDTGAAYKKGTPFNGLTAVTEKPSGAEVNDLWADGIKYAGIRGAENFGATMEAYTYPDEFAECDGSAIVSEGVFLGQQTRKNFGFSFRSMIGDDQHDSANLGYKIHMLYGLSCAPSERAYNTINESPDAATFSWELSSTPVTVSGYKATSIVTVDSTKVAPDKLKKLEDALYGTAETEAYLPLPDEVLALLK